MKNTTGGFFSDEDEIGKTPSPITTQPKAGQWDYRNESSDSAEKGWRSVSQKVFTVGIYQWRNEKCSSGAILRLTCNCTDPLPQLRRAKALCEYLDTVKLCKLETFSGIAKAWIHRHPLSDFKEEK